MSHRHHKSTKVPNVKLRPVARPAASAGSPASLDDLSLNRTLEAQYAERDRRDDRNAKRRRVAAHDDDQGDEQDDDDDLPLKGAFFCFTGVGEEKTALAQAATSLGATVEGNLTETTTHLIAINCGSQKYQFALQLGLYILRPSFLYTLHDKWQQAQPTNMESLLSSHALPPLQGLVVGLAGVSDREAKASLKQRLTRMGARLEFPMTFDSGVTHLVCGVSSRKESNTLDLVWQLRKNHVGTAEERKGATQLHCVWLDWVDDCERVGGSIPEEKYDIWAATSGRKSSRPARPLRQELCDAFPSRDPDQMKRRYADKVRENQQGYVKKLEQVESKKGEEKRSPTAAASKKTVDTTAHRATPGKKDVKTPERQEKSSSTAPKPHTKPRTTSGLLSMPRNVTEEQQPQPQTAPPQKQEPSTATTPEHRPLAKTHIQLDLSPRDDNKLDLAREACYDGGARLVVDERQWSNILRSNPSTPAYLVVSIHCPAAQREKQLALQARLRTEHGATLHLVTLSWLEQCLFWEDLIDPSNAKQKDPTGYPYLPILTAPSTALHLSLNYTIALTNFPPQDDSPHRAHLTQALVSMGFKVTETFGKKQNTHLLSRFKEELRAGETWEQFGKRRKVSVIKEVKAVQWGIPVVGLDFLRCAWTEGTVREEDRPRVSSGETQGQTQSVLDETQFAVLDETAGGGGAEEHREEEARDEQAKDHVEAEPTEDSVMAEAIKDDCGGAETGQESRSAPPHDEIRAVDAVTAVDCAKQSEAMDVDTHEAPAVDTPAGSKTSTSAARSNTPGVMKTSTSPVRSATPHIAKPSTSSARSNTLKRPSAGHAPSAAVSLEPQPTTTLPESQIETPAAPIEPQPTTTLPESQTALPTAPNAPESQTSPPNAPHVYAPETLAGQSMWATRMQDEVEALLSSRGTSNSANARASRKPRRSTGKRSLTPHSGALADDSVSPLKGALGGSDFISPHKSTLGSDTISPHKSTDSISPHKSTLRSDSISPQKATSTHDEDQEEIEHSMRVTYRDPAAERERRRLEELVERGQRAKEQEQYDVTSGSGKDTTQSSPPPQRQDTFGTGRNRPSNSLPSPKKKIVARRQPGTGR